MKMQLGSVKCEFCGANIAAMRDMKTGDGGAEHEGGPCTDYEKVEIMTEKFKVIYAQGPQPGINRATRRANTARR